MAHSQAEELLSMERRGFLKGMFGGVTAAGLVIAANPAEIEAFASPLVRDAPLVLDAAPVVGVPGVGEHLYNSRGELVAIINEIRVSTDTVDVSSAFGGGNKMFVPGRRHIDIQVECIATGLDYQNRNMFPMLRGTTCS
jgi:hypothetical protein